MIWGKNLFKGEITFSGELKILIDAAITGTVNDIDFIVKKLENNPDFATTRFVDFALSFVENEEGIKRIEHYLFNGNLMQRNYCSLYFNRKFEWEIVKRAYDLGLIDEIQAYAR